jgi:hypothetical protein
MLTPTTKVFLLVEHLPEQQVKGTQLCSLSQQVANMVSALRELPMQLRLQ